MSGTPLGPEGVSEAFLNVLSALYAEVRAKW